MVEFVTAEKLGRRPAPSGASPIQGYDAGIEARAAYEAGDVIKGIGQGMEQFGGGLLEKQRKEDERARKTNDALLEAQLDSTLLQASLDKSQEFADRNDYENFQDESIKLLSDVSAPIIDGFSDDAREFAQIKVNNFMAKNQFSLNTLVREKMQSRDSVVAMGITDSSLASLAKTGDLEAYDAGRKAIIANGAKWNKDPVVAAVELKEYDKKAAYAYAASLKPQDRLNLANDALGEYNDDVFALYADEIKNSGISEKYYRKLAMVESSGDASAKNKKSSAGGLFQFIDSTAKEVGLKDKFDPSQSMEAVIKFTDKNREFLKDTLGREPTDSELYLAHQQGRSGAIMLLKEPDRLAVDTVGKRAVVNNGGSEDMTNAEFADLWISKFEVAKPVGAIYSRTRSETLIDKLDVGDIEKIRNGAVASLVDDLSSLSSTEMRNYTSTREFLSLPEKQQVSVAVKLDAMAKQKDLLVKQAALNREYQANDAIFEKHINGTLTYTEIENEKNIVESNSELTDAEKQIKLRMLDSFSGDIVLTKQERVEKGAKNLSEAAAIKAGGKGVSNKKRAEIYNSMYAKFSILNDEFGKDVRKSRAKGLGELLKFQSELAENSSAFTLSEMKDFKNLTKLLYQKVGKLIEYGGRAKLDKEGEYYLPLTKMSSFLDMSDGINSSESQVRLMADLVSNFDAVAEGGRVPPAKQNEVFNATIGNFLREQYPSLADYEDGNFPARIRTANGGVIIVPPRLRSKSAEGVKTTRQSKPKFIPLQKYKLVDRDGFVTLKDLQAKADASGLTVEETISRFKRLGVIR